MKTYKELKEQARIKFIDWQSELYFKNMSYDELIKEQNKIDKLAKRYGLIKELKENGVL